MAEHPAARTLHWRPEWQRFQPWEYALTAAALGTAFGLVIFGPSPPHDENSWDFEQDLADALAVRGGAASVLRTAGDIGYVGTMVYRLIDSALVPSIAWQREDVAWQLLMMDLEAFSLVGLTVWGAQSLIGRERPRFRDCPGEAPRGTSCTYFGDNRYRSFIAGHVAIATAGASLTCLHHARLGLYGGGTADDVACGTHIAAAVTTAVSRVTVEQHYVTDTLLGAALGLFAGYVVPSALHYGFGTPRAQGDHATARKSPHLHMTLLPLVQESQLGVSAVGSF